MYFYDKKEKNFLNDEVNEITQGCIQITDEEFQTLVDKRSSGAIIYVKDGKVKASEIQPGNEYKFDEKLEKWLLDDKLKTQALANAKQNGVAQIDDLVGSIYLKFTRFDKEYQRREEQAKAFKANGYKGEVPLQVNAFASNVGISPQQATDIILQQAAKLTQALDILGNLRMKKYQINQQETIEDVQKVTKQLIDEIQKVGGQL